MKANEVRNKLNVFAVFNTHCTLYLRVFRVSFIFSIIIYSHPTLRMHTIYHILYHLNICIIVDHSFQ